ncbi:GNAT family N-acetyltransferase [Thomasclavelia sp.]|uniref:GNAT family N-acetyltransferase n=1 Tax=Thomasclavelia sp. TaxID=3025757 RepID=UPI0025F6ADAA|nr:GNAT family N-acetyltransferase [Thomasclavelia sp.]
MAKLVYPQKEHEQMIKAYIQECYDHGEMYINGDGGCHLESDYQKWLKRQKQDHLGINLKENFVPATTYFYLEGDKIIGTINIRHCLNDFLLKQGGHIGYSILPSMRKKGYATAMLKEAIAFCKKWDIYPILITCNKENIASRKTIEKCGGKLENEYFNQTTKETRLRFWIGEEND